MLKLWPALAAGLLMACAKEGPDRSEASPDEGASKQLNELISYLETPEYREVRRLQGRYSSGFEASLTELCETDPIPCDLHRNIDGAPQECWTEFTESASGIVPRRDGSFWIEFDGQIAMHPGSFGHLGQYTCQIRIVRIHRLYSAEANNTGLGPNLVR